MSSSEIPPSLSSLKSEPSIKPSLPHGLTAATLVTAKVKELNAWAKVVNEGFPARKKPIKISVPKPKLVEALAVFYQLDLSQTPVTAPAKHPITVSEHILERQWDDFVAIAEERDLAERNGIPFLLMKNANFPGTSNLFLDIM
jgi:hypothetical protein